MLTPAGLTDIEVFDSVIVVTDRRLLDQQIQRTIRGFMQVKSTVGHATSAGELRGFIAQGMKIIVTTVQKFPHVLEVIAEVSNSRGMRTAWLRPLRNSDARRSVTVCSQG